MFSGAARFCFLNNSFVAFAFKFDSPLRIKLFNYTYIAFSYSYNSIPCCCNIADYIHFIYSFYGHMITGNPNIVKN